MIFKSATDCYTLNNGLKIPCVGFGTWQSRAGDECYNAVLDALKAGYHHIDTAQRYENEESVGQAFSDFLKSTNQKRQDFFITTKLSNVVRGYSETIHAFEESLKKLQLEYLDLFLIHWPNPIKYRDNWQQANENTWSAMQDLYKSGRVHSIGVSNFRVHHLEALAKTAKVLPVVNQIKLTPGIFPKDLIQYCKDKNILLEAYSPIGTGGAFCNPKLQDVASKNKKTVAQVCLNWSLHQGFLPLPKSVHKERIKENLDIFDFDLGDSTYEALKTIEPVGVRPPHDPDKIDF